MKIIDCYKELMKAKLVTVVKLFNEGEDIVKELEYNSKLVKEGAAFFCKGETFRKEYLLEAIDRGAVCYVSEHVVMGDNAHKTSTIIVSDVRKAMSILAKKFYFPNEDDIDIIGITGTKGKSTTTYMLKSIMNEYMKSIGEDECAFISGIEIYDGVNNKKAELTTPETLDLFKHIRNAINMNKKAVIMEISSQALKYGRCHGLRFDIAALLNISNDHISSREHPTYEDYFKSKLLIFNDCKKAWVNSEIDEINEIKKYARCDLKTFGLSKNDNIAVQNIIEKNNELDICLKIYKEDFDFTIPMAGKFNAYNAVAAIAVAYDYGIPVGVIKTGLLNSFVPGRMEMFRSNDNKIVAIIDYAHNGDSFEKIFEHVKKNYTDRKIAVTFGCVGGKAYNRRKETGEVSSKYANNIYIVPNNPAEENYKNIGKDIVSHMIPGPEVVEILNSREEGIREAFNYTKGSKDDWVILILGKSRDDYQIIGNKKMKCKTNYEVLNELISKDA